MKTLYTALKEASKSDDFIQLKHSIRGQLFYFSYYKPMVNQEQLHHDILSIIQFENREIHDLSDLKNLIPIEGIKLTSNLKDISLSLTKGSIFVQLDSNLNEGMLINVAQETTAYRKNNSSENEYSVIGPKVAFVESLDSNMNLLRKEIVTEKLIFEEQTLGSVSKTRVVIVYIDGIANPLNINTVRQRLSDMDFDVVFDTAILDQIISDNSNSPFPLFLPSERVDRIKYSLLNGQVAILSDGSPYVISAPSTVFDFFISPEDYYLPWILGSFFRLIRYYGVLFSILATPIYVSIITFHYMVVPEDLLLPIIESRANVPFPPIIEALLLEITVELIREAGARLPAKVGQSLGIVGGVVLGTAAVEAGLTSTILVILVSLSALSSFTTPIFKMANTIRFLRFPLIALAGLYGGLGIMVGLILLGGHLLRLKSLGTPYIIPLFPFRYKDFRDSFIRSSLSLTWGRPSFLRPLKSRRFTVQKHKDIGDDFKNE